MERRDGEVGLAFRVIEHTMIAGMAVRGWARVHLLRKPPCECGRYMCPKTRGGKIHVPPPPR